jgi:hypothetical protein
MTLSNILKYSLIKISLILLFLVPNAISGQTKVDVSSKKDTITDIEEIKDTLNYKFGLRFGIDISGPFYSIFDSDETLLKGSIDARIYKDYFVAAEIGFATKDYKEVNLEYETKGQFLTIGVDYNMLGYKEGSNDILYFGVRYGISNYNTTVSKYKIQNGYWLDDAFISNLEQQDGNGHWLNARFGVKVEVLKNLYLGGSVGMNRLIYASSLKSFDNLYIPGFGSNNDKKSFQFNYTLLYMLPFN